MKLNEKQTRVFAVLNKVLGKEGYSVRLVGGAVRDLLQGKEPKDLDFATDAHPNVANKLLTSALIHTIPTGLKHGTITAVIRDEPIEITTLRIDASTDGRHAEVEFTDDWEEDARRRDLTINAMSMDSDGVVYDYFGGQIDLMAGKLEFVGDTRKRVREDYLRILRYFRFASHIEKLSWNYDILDILREESVGLEQISGERIWSELIKILSGKNRYNVLYAMDAYGILKNIGIDWKIEFKTYWEFLRLTESARNLSPLLYLASLMRNMDDVQTLRDRWKFDTNSFKILSYIVSNRENLFEIGENDVKPMLLRGEDPNLMYHYACYRQHWSVVAMLEDIRKEPLPKFPVTGNDLKAMGVPPGPSLGEMLSSLKEDWIESGYKMTKEELLNGKDM